MKTWKGALLALLIVGLATGASAQTKGIGAYWDQDATQTVKTYGGINFELHTLYVIAVNTEQTVGGAAFVLGMIPDLTLVQTVYPQGVQFGDPKAGVEVGFTDCYIGYFGNPVLVATMTVLTPQDFGSHVDFEILPHPAYGDVVLSDCSAELTVCDGFTARLTSLVDAESPTWGEFKSLFR